MISIGLCSCQYGMWFDDGFILKIEKKEKRKNLGIGNVRVIIINCRSMYFCLKFYLYFCFLLSVMFIIYIFDFT